MPNITCTVTSFADGWYRITTKATDTNSGNTASAIRLTPGSITELGYVYIWGAQLEEQPAATSYIPTAGAAVTRSSDNLNNALVKVDNMPPLTEPFSIAIKFYPTWVAGDLANRLLVGINDYLSQFYLNLKDGITGPTITANVLNGTVAQPPANSITLNTLNSLVFTSDGTTTSLYIDGVLADTGTVGTTEEVAGYIDIGNLNNGSHAECAVQSLKIFNKALSADEVAAL
jgi:hypothetical protein